MTRIHRAVLMSFGVALLWATLATGVQGYSGTTGRMESRLGPDWVQLRGHVLCAGCTLEELRAAPSAPRSRLYQLHHQRGQVVMYVNPACPALSSHHLWLRGGDHLFETLAAEENLFREIAVAGLWREYLPTAGTLDLATVQVLGEE